ncbi:MAG: hypothetical protein IJJ16_06255, partial [Mogibacterium sp.]|nr:hypothetical protein [Mogibacterium sp.]
RKCTMLENTIHPFFGGEMLLFGASSIHRQIILFIGTDDQQFLSYNPYLASAGYVITFKRKNGLQAIQIMPLVIIYYYFRLSLRPASNNYASIFASNVLPVIA